MIKENETLKALVREIVAEIPKYAEGYAHPFDTSDLPDALDRLLSKYRDNPVHADDGGDGGTVRILGGCGDLKSGALSFAPQPQTERDAAQAAEWLKLFKL